MGINVTAMYSGGGEWLTGSDLIGRTVRAEIESCEMAQSQFDGKDQIVLHFRGKDKKLGLNKTNGTEIMRAFGPDTDGWIGKQVDLFSIKTSNPQGQVVDAVRLTAVTPDSPKPAAAAPDTPSGSFQQPAAAGGFDDDLPF